VQEYIVGPEYGFFALFNKGRLRASFQHRRVLSVDYRGGASAISESIYIEELEELGIRLLQALKWHGPAMAEFKYDVGDKKFKLMEINPRFWGSLNLAVVAGIDFPYLYYKIAKDGNCENARRYREKITSHYLYGELEHLISLVRVHEDINGLIRHSILRQMWFILSMMKHATFDGLDRKDVVPCIMYLRDMIRHLHYVIFNP
jgi:predicted ATP-grasp superfamily ATP-dependent carboligase